MKTFSFKFLEVYGQSRFAQHRSLELKAFAVGILAGLTGVFFQLGVGKVALEKLKSSSQFSSQTQDSILATGWFSAGLVSMVMITFAFWLVRRVAPEAGGSGIQEITGYLGGLRTIRWRRVLPVKFISGILAMGSGMVLGRGGPEVHMGGACGAMVNNLTLKNDSTSGHALVSAGAAAGLAAAFNAPLAGVIFVMEEMRNPFHYNFLNIRLLTIAALAATLVVHLIIGSRPPVTIPQHNMPAWREMLLFLFMGGIIGVAGAALNRGILIGLDIMDKLKKNKIKLYLCMTVFAFAVGVLHYFFPEMVGGGYELIGRSLAGEIAFKGLLFFILIRISLTVICFSTGLPGGVFAPMIVLGTLLGLWGGQVVDFMVPNSDFDPYPFAVAGMGALFAATVQAPITSIVLVVEMTGNYSLIIPIMIACIGADIVAHELGTRPLYGELLARELK